MARAVHVTPELLRNAWAGHRKPHWPDTFEATMENPLLSRYVRAFAIGDALAADKPPRHTTARHPAFTRKPLPPGAFDARRAAANDLEDDDA